MSDLSILDKDSARALVVCMTRVYVRWERSALGQSAFLICGVGKRYDEKTERLRARLQIARLNEMCRSQRLPTDLREPLQPVLVFLY